MSTNRGMNKEDVVHISDQIRSVTQSTTRGITWATITWVTTMLIRLRIAKLLRTHATITVVPATLEVAAKVVYLPLSYASKEDSGESYILELCSLATRGTQEYGSLFHMVCDKNCWPSRLLSQMNEIVVYN